jgi:hypothetical protein
MSNSQETENDPSPPWVEEEEIVEHLYEPQPLAWWYLVDHEHDVRTKAFGSLFVEDGCFWICNEAGDTVVVMPMDGVHALRADAYEDVYNLLPEDIKDDD